MKITVYTLPKSVCVKCRATELSMRFKGIEAVSVRVDENPEAMEYVKSLGYSEAPVVVITDGDEVVDHWSGFSENKIASLKEMVAA